MEGYNEVENDACDAHNDATAGAAKGREHEMPGHNMQMIRHVGEEEGADRSQLIDIGVFKPTSGNATKRLRLRQATRGTARTDKTAEATLKQIATQEFQAEKGKMEIWKQVIMQEVGHEIQAIKQIHDDAIEAQKQEMEAQRHSFSTEIEMLKERLQQEEKQSASFANEIKILKTQAQVQQPSQDTSTVKIMPTVHPKPINEIKFRNIEDGLHEISNSHCLENSKSRVDQNAAPLPPSSSIKSQKKRRDYASVAASKPAKIPDQPWIKVSYGTRKKQPNSGSKQEQLCKRLTRRTTSATPQAMRLRAVLRGTA